LLKRNHVVVLLICLSLVTLPFVGCVAKSSTNPPAEVSTPNINKMQSDINALQNEVVALKTSVVNLQALSQTVSKADIDALKSANTLLETKVADLAKQVSASQTAMPSLTGLAKQVDVDLLNTKVGGITANVTDIQSQIKALQDTSKSLTDAINAAKALSDSKDTSQDTQITTLQTALTVLTARVTALEVTPVAAKPAVHISGVSVVAIALTVDAGGNYPIVLNAYGVDNGGDFGVSVIGGNTVYASIIQDSRIIYNTTGIIGKVTILTDRTTVNMFSGSLWPDALDSGDYYIKIGADPVYHLITNIDADNNTITIDEQYTGVLVLTTGYNYVIYSLDNSPNRTATVVITPPIGTGWVAGNLINVSIQGMNVQYATAQVGG
jgi:hypothetical protein